MSNFSKSNNSLDNSTSIFRAFTTGNNYQLDQSYFLKYDLLINKIWAEELHQCGIYSTEELKLVKDGLGKISDSYKSGNFIVKPEEENCHVAIENALVQLIGNAGKKIHTGRSRNDQSLTMVRMFMADALIEISNSVTELSDKMSSQFLSDSGSVFIGYSHMQQAMATTIGHYFSAHSESLQDDAEHIASVYKHINKCPLGTGCGFGSPLEVDRSWIARQLNFHGVQNNSLYCQNSNGKFELLYIQSLSQVMLSLQRFANDMITYTSKEFSLFKMSDNICQDSDISPQKRNPDVFEMIRAKSADVFALEEKIKFIVKGMPSGYNRDLQEIKACIVDAYNIVRNCIYIISLSLEHIKPDMESIYNKLTRDVVSADYVASMCIKDKNLNFKELYLDYLHHVDVSPHDAIALRVSKGSPFNF